MTLNPVNTFKSREENKFLALLARTQEKAAKITGAARRTFANSNGRHRKVSNRKCYNKILNPHRSSSNESGSTSSSNDKNEYSYETNAMQKTRLQNFNLRESSLSSSHTTDGECLNSSEEHLSDNVWESLDESGQGYDWRLPKYVETLEQWLQDLEKHPQGPKKETIGEYRLKVEFLRKVVTTLEDEKLEVEAKCLINTTAVDDDPRYVRKTSLPTHRGSPSGGFNRRQASPATITLPLKGYKVLPHGQAATADVISKEIHQKLEGRQAWKVRDELFNCDGEGNTNGNESGQNLGDLHQAGAKSQGDSQDLDSLLQAHHAAQEKVAEEMISLTRSLKEQTRVAGEIVRKDTRVMERSNQLAEANTGKLQVESERLSEHRGSACRCWVWFLLLIVCFTFVAMVMVMKLFRKRRHDEL